MSLWGEVEAKLKAKGAGNIIPRAIAQVGSTEATKTNSENPEHGEYGLWQWGGARKTRLLQFAEEHHESPESLNLQVDYLWWELHNAYADVWNAMAKAKTVNEAIVPFVEKYEIPADIPGKIREAQNLAFGPPVTGGTAGIVPGTITVKTQEEPADRSPKIRFTGKAMSESGNHFQGHEKALRSLFGRTLKYPTIRR